MKCFSYIRTSSMSNVGADKDSGNRQRSAIRAFAEARGFVIAAEYSDDGVSGEAEIGTRPGFSEMLSALASNGVRTVIVEDASRFARKLMTQEAGIAILQSLGVTVFTANGDELTNSDDELRIAMRQIAGVFSQLEKTRLVKKLSGARQRAREARGKCEGRKGFSELAEKDEGLSVAITLAKSLRASGASLRAIAAELAAAGHVSSTGKVYTAKSVASMTA